MTTLRHQILDQQSKPVAGRLAAVSLYDDRVKPGNYQRHRAVSAVSDAQGWLTWTLPAPEGHGDQEYVVTGIENRQVIVTVPRGVSTALVSDTRTGTLPLPAHAADSIDLVTEVELAGKLGGVVRFVDKNGAPVQGLGVTVVVDTATNQVDDIVVVAS